MSNDELIKIAKENLALAAMGRCLLCGQIKEVRYIDLYVVGSEGLYVCHDCEMEVVAAVKAIANRKSRERMEAYLAKKRELEATMPC